MGQRCSTVAAGTRGSNVHLIGAISCFGLISHQIRRGSFTKQDAIIWMASCLQTAMVLHGGPVTLIID